MTPPAIARAVDAPHEPPFGPQLVRHYLSDLVYGANDGIITTLAVLSGVAGATLPGSTALILGAANLFADGFSMGASNFLAIRSREAVRAADGHAVDEPFPARHAAATWGAFVVAGAIPLILYALTPVAVRSAVSVAGALVALFVVGALRAAVTPLRWIRAGAEMLVVGAAAALVSYGTGALLAYLI